MSNPNGHAQNFLTKRFQENEALALFNDCLIYVPDAETTTFVSIDGDIRAEFIGGATWHIYRNGEFYTTFEL